MKTIRTAILSAVITLSLSAAIYIAVVPQTVRAESSCGTQGITWLTTEQLKNLVNGRFENRVHLPR